MKKIYAISTYGFRGEALSSIAEVSQVTIMTKTKEDNIATKLSNAS
jgi:DNA mismatch repair protein MutL